MVKADVPCRLLPSGKRFAINITSEPRQSKSYGLAGQYYCVVIEDLT